MSTKPDNTLLNPALRILLVTNGLIFAATAMLGPIYALFVEEIGGDILDAGLTSAVFALAAGITIFFSARLTDKGRNPQTIVTVGYAVIAVGFFAYLFVTNLFTLLLVQLVVGFGQAFYSPAFDALFSSHLDKHKFGRQWGSWEVMYYFVTAGGAALGGWVASVYGFAILFVIMGVVASLGSLLLATAPKMSL